MKNKLKAMGYGKKHIALNVHCSINTKGELLLYGLIGDWWEGMDALSIVRDLEALSGDQIVVRIHSTGGVVVEGMAMYNALKNSGKRIVVYIDGVAASMASAIAMAGDEVHIPTNALLMLHKPWGGAEGNANDMREAAEQLDVIEQSYLQLYADKTGKTIEKIAELIGDGKNHFFRGQEAIDYGLADVLIEHTIQAVAMAKLDALDIPEAYANSLFNQSAATAASNKQGNEPMLFHILACAGGGRIAAKIKAELDAKYASVKDALVVIGAEHQNAITGEAEASIEDLGAIAAKLGLEIPAPAAGDSNPDVSQIAAQAADAALAKYKARAKKIRDIGAMARVDADTIAAWADSNMTIEQVQAKALEHVSALDSAGGIQASHIRGSTAAPGVLRNAIALALLNRIDPQAHALDDNAGEFRGASVLDTAKAFLQSRGESIRGKGKQEIIAMAMHTTSDYPLILQDAANKVLQPAYKAKVKTFMSIARQVNVSDFRMRKGVQLGGGSDLAKVNQNGEFKRGTVTEGGYGWAIDTYGRVFDFSRQLIINDDVDAFGRFFRSAGSAAARLESKVFWDVFKAGKMSDGSDVFSSARKNKVAGTAINEASVSAARKAMRQLKGLDGEPIQVSAKMLVVNTERETEAEKFLSAVLASSTSDVNIFAGSLGLVVESELDGVTNNPFYFFADPADVNAMVFSYLEGEAQPFIETQWGFNTDGVSIKVRHDFGAGFEDFRGVIQGTGAAS